MRLFENFDFSLLEDENFKEDSVREEILILIFNKLGFKASGDKKIIRSKKLAHPFVTIGSKEKPINIYPDYILELNKKCLLVLDAKAPSENIRTGKNVSQAYSYSIHPEINCDKFALCNGYELIFFKVTDGSPALIIEIPKVSDSWNDIVKFLSEETQLNEKKEPGLENDKFYLTRKLPNIIRKPKKQATKRHFGVHGYFTKQSWDIVDRYIRNFTREGDTILDPFGGSGVTLIESLMNGRNAIHIDLNPLCIFWMEALLNDIDTYKLKQESDKIISKFAIESENLDFNMIQSILPKNVELLSKGADVSTLHSLFSKKQLKELGLLKKLILNIKNKNIRHSLFLAFSSSISRFNLTFHMTKSLGGGDSGPFRYYRYRIAPTPTELSLTKIFKNKVKNLIKAKKELKVIQAEAWYAISNLQR